LDLSIDFSAKASGISYLCQVLLSLKDSKKPPFRSIAQEAFVFVSFAQSRETGV
jgi:hypothetical protein